MFLLGIAGPAQSGKTTIANTLLELLNDGVAPWTTCAFADPIKAMVTAMGIENPDQYKTIKHPIFGVTSREMYQTLGTEWAQGLMGKDVWVKALRNRLKDSDNVIVSDVRFPHEAQFIRENGLLIHVTGRGGINTTHVSESPLRVSRYDKFVDNSRTWDKTFTQLEDLCDVIESDTRILRSCG